MTNPSYSRRAISQAGGRRLGQLRRRGEGADEAGEEFLAGSQPWRRRDGIGHAEFGSSHPAPARAAPLLLPQFVVNWLAGCGAAPRQAGDLEIRQAAIVVGNSYSQFRSPREGDVGEEFSGRRR